MVTGVFPHCLSPVPARWGQQSWCCSPLQPPQVMGADPSELGYSSGLLLQNPLGGNLHGIQGSGLTLLFSYPNISSLPMSVFHISVKYLDVQAPLTLTGTMESSFARKQSPWHREAGQMPAEPSAGDGEGVCVWGEQLLLAVQGCTLRAFCLEKQKSASAPISDLPRAAMHLLEQEHICAQGKVEQSVELGCCTGAEHSPNGSGNRTSPGVTHPATALQELTHTG